MAHFGFHDRSGNRYAIFHQKHFLGLVGDDDELVWTVAAKPVIEGIPNITAALNFPIYLDNLADGALIVSNFGDARIYQIKPDKMSAQLIIDGSKLGMKDAGNCVVDDEDCIWVNEVKGCKVWRFDKTGTPLLTLGDGTPGFQSKPAPFHKARFNWIYDIRRGPDGNIYVLDSKNFALRRIDLDEGLVHTIAGTGETGYEGDNEDAKYATFGSDPTARFDGPISLSLDKEGNIFVGDRHNHVVRMIHADSGNIRTIAGNHNSLSGKSNDPEETDPLKLNLPEISSMDYYDDRLFVPTDLTPETGDLVVLRRMHD